MTQKRDDKTEAYKQTTSTLPKCGSCGGTVTKDFYRVFATTEGFLAGCINCQGKSIDWTEVFGR